MAREECSSTHHIIPTSRGGRDIFENKIKIDPKIHEAWHALFGNLLLEEVCILIIHCWATKKGNIDKKYIRGFKRYGAWIIFFNKVAITPEEALAIIYERFKLKRA